MPRHLIATLALTATAIACGSPAENAVATLAEQVRLGDPLAPRTYAENKEVIDRYRTVVPRRSSKGRVHRKLTTAQHRLRRLAIRPMSCRNRLALTGVLP